MEGTFAPAPSLQRPVLGPHHMSLGPNGDLLKIELGSEPDNKRLLNSEPENKRLSVVQDENNRDTKRDSQISTTSTNASSPRMRPRKRHIGPWCLGTDLGVGATGRVRKAQHAVTGQLAAVKVLGMKKGFEYRSTSAMDMDLLIQKNSKNKSKSLKRRQLPFTLQREIAVMKLIEHPNIIKLYDIWENHGEL